MRKVLLGLPALAVAIAAVFASTGQSAQAATTITVQVGSGATGYAVEIAMLIDAWREVGLDGLAQVDIEMRQNRHQPLGDLTQMAYAVLRAVCLRLEREGRLSELEDAGLVLPRETLEARDVRIVERPPLASIRTA